MSREPANAENAASLERISSIPAAGHAPDETAAEAGLMTLAEATKTWMKLVPATNLA
jgi:hypothetical protein